MKFVIEGKLAGMNDIISLARTHWSKSNDLKHEETERCAWAIRMARIDPILEPVLIHFDWYEPNAKRDVGNIRAGEKFISDALVMVGVLKDDSQKWVRGMSDRFMIDRENPRVEVTITTL